MKAIIKKSRDGQLTFVLKGNNGKVIAAGETYKRRAGALNTLSKYFPQFEVVDATIREKVAEADPYLDC